MVFGIKKYSEKMQLPVDDWQQSHFADSNVVRSLGTFVK